MKTEYQEMVKHAAADARIMGINGVMLFESCHALVKLARNLKAFEILLLDEKRVLLELKVIFTQDT